MAERKSGFEWLDTSNNEAIDWAYKYLIDHGQRPPTPFEEKNPAALLTKGERLGKTPEGRELITSMRNAYRQIKWRASRPELKSRAFRLHKQTSAKLDSLAKKEQVTANDLIEMLITDTAKAHAGISKKLTESKRREKDEKTKANLREAGLAARITQLETMLSEALIHFSYYEIVCGSQDALLGPPNKATQKRAHDRYQERWAEAQQRLSETKKRHEGVQDMKRALERST